MDKQPEALRLADEFEKQIWNSAYRAAKELRRLHQVNRELVEALEWIVRVNATDYEYQQKAREALAKLREKNT